MRFQIQRKPLVRLVLIVLLGFAAWQAVTLFLAEANCATERNSTLHRDPRPELAQIERAIDLQPDKAAYRAKRGAFFYRRALEAERGSTAMAEALREAVAGYEAAVQRNPVQADYWYELGRCYKRMRYVAESWGPWLRKADKAFETALHLKPNSAWLAYRVGHYWVWRSRTMPEREGSGLQGTVQLASEAIGRMEEVLPSSRAEGISRFQTLFAHAVGLRRGRQYVDDAAERIWYFYPRPEVVRGMVPEGNGWVDKRVDRFLGKKAK